MESFQPIVNLLVLLTVLSLAAERVANLVKLGRPKLRNHSVVVRIKNNVARDAKEVEESVCD